MAHTLAVYAKAVVAFIGTLAGALVLVMESNELDRVQDLTQLQWLIIVTLVLGTTGTVAAVPNARDPSPDTSTRQPVAGG